MTEEVVYGRHPVVALLRSAVRRVDEIAILAGGRGPLVEVEATARRAGIKVSYRTRDQLTAIAGSPDHQGVVARVAAAAYADVDALLGLARERAEPAFLLALDQVQDPRNLGAVLRTADVFGVHGVIVTKHHAVGLTAAAARTAMGAAEAVPVARETNLVNALEGLKSEGVWVYGAVPQQGRPPWEVDLTGPVCIVLGSEGPGVRPLVSRTCDALLTIPVRGRVGSLNVAAAASALCYEALRQRAVAKKSGLTSKS